MSNAFDLQRLYDDHASALFAFLLNLTRDETDTRDVLQDIFVKLAHRPDRLTGVTDPRGFLIRLAHNQAIDLIRRRTAHVQRQDRFATTQPAIFLPGTNADEENFRQALAAALGELPPDHRAVVHLKLWEEMSFAAIATALNISPDTAASRYRYGLDKLRDRLRPLYTEIKNHG